ncbi:TIGR02266 family protein [Thermodesulfobacteriota bacterium]
MFSIASEETHPDGKIIFQEGSSGDWVYVILAGSVEISKTVAGKKCVMAMLKKGEVFGELSFLGNITRTATACAVGETTLGVIDRSSLDTEFNNLSSDFRTILVSTVNRFKMMIDRASDFSDRSAPRIAKTLSLNFKDGHAFIKAYTGDISNGGLFIKTAKPLKQGEQFLLKLQLPGLSEPMKIKSEVAWARTQKEGEEKAPAGMGVKFCEMEQKDREIIKQFLEGFVQE